MDKISYNLKVLGEPKKVPIERYLLISHNFQSVYNTYKGAKIAKGKRKFIDYEIEPIIEYAWEYDVELL